MQFAQVKVESSQHEMNIGTCSFAVDSCHFVLQLGHGDAARDSSSAVNKLCSLDCEVVAEMRHLYALAVGEVPIKEIAVAKITGRDRHLDVWKSSAFCFADFLLCFRYCGIFSLDCLVVFIRQCKDLLQRQDTRLLGIHTHTT